MENEKKYIITIDGTDCTGKTTLWKNTTISANETKNVQIRGIVSNIAYALKFGRNVDELIDLYNQNPVNYVVYLINPSNDKKLEMLLTLNLRIDILKSRFAETQMRGWWNW